MVKGRILFIDEKTVLKTLTPRTANTLTAKAFRENIPEKVQLPEKVYLTLEEGDFRAMPAYARLGAGICGVKWISVFPKNSKAKRPVVNGTMLLSDPRDGSLMAVMEANALTALRTGAAGAVASRCMANPRPRILSLVGAGVQSEYQLRCHRVFFRFREVRVWSPTFREAGRFASRLRRFHAGIEPMRSLSSCVEGADIISTCTPSRRPLLMRGWVRAGAHINAIGADAKGKRELASSLLRHSRIFVDHREQAMHSGEINVPLLKGEIRPSHIRGSITDVIRGKVKARHSPRDITVFDSTGLAIQDLILADYLYRRLSGRSAR